MDNRINLDDLLEPTTKGGFPGPTLRDLRNAGFQLIGFYAVKRNNNGDVLEAYKITECKEYYLKSTIEEFNTYFDERASDICGKLKR